MRLKLAVFLVALMACDTADVPREVLSPTDPTTPNLALSTRAEGAGPAIEITIPVRSGLTPALVPSVTTFEWGTVDGAVSPDSVRWILMSAEDGYAQTIDYLRDQFDEASWSAWHLYEPGNGIGVSWTTPPMDLGPYVLAVHGKKDDVIDRTLDEQFNVRRIRVSLRSSGPLLTLTSNLRDPVVTTSVNTPPTIVNVAAGVPMEFCWTANAGNYGGVVVEHRYGWDILDPGDPEAWDVVSDYDGGEFCADPITFQFGAHVFYVETFDNNGYSSRIPVRLNITDPPDIISMDVRPGACPNPVNPKSRGVLWVALPGSSTLNARDVDLSTVSLGLFSGSTETAKPTQSKIQDVTAPVAGSGGCDCPGRGPDGVDDLSLKFSLGDIALDPVPDGDVQLALYGSTRDGQPFIAVDCVRIVGVKDDDGPEPTGLDTEILQVWNSYSLGGQIITEPINTTDAIPDTVPYGSWITLYYDGTPDPATEPMCNDPVNQCIAYQKAYVRSSPYHPGAMSMSGWQPRGFFEDNDPLARPDSTSMNMGTVDYLVRVRSVDLVTQLPDASPAEVTVVGNFQPTLTRFALESFDGTGPDIAWDWWRPANFHGGATDTLDFSDPGDPLVVREFYFVVKGEGRDHPRERDRGGVKAWLYQFEDADDSSLMPLGRSGAWIPGIHTDAMCDTVRFAVSYSLIDDPGGWNAWAGLPDWIGRDYNVTLRGRDTALDEEEFRQYMFVDGQKALINAYPVGVLGRQTEESTIRSRVSLSRDDLPTPAGSHTRAGVSRR